MSRTIETTIEIDDTLPVVRTIREFDAPPEKVFRAHTDPELFARWVGPHGMSGVIDTWDARTGGEYRYAMQGEGEETHWFRGSFHELRGHERLVQTFCYEPWPDGVVLETLEFEALEGGRCRLTVTSLSGSFEERDGLIASGMEQGVREGFAKLDAVLAG